MNADQAARDQADARPGESAQSGGFEPTVAQPSQEELEQLVRERDEYLAGWKRSQADYQNLRRRTQSDIDASVRRSQQRVFEGLLLAIDHLELALSAPCTTEEARRIANGVRLTRDQMLRLLEQEGVRPMPAAKRNEERFDPARHLVVQSIEREDLPPGTVLDTVRAGYSWGDLVLRPAQVVVAAAALEAAAPVQGELENGQGGAGRLQEAEGTEDPAEER